MTAEAAGSFEVWKELSLATGAGVPAAPSAGAPAAPMPADREATPAPAAAAEAAAGAGEEGGGSAVPLPPVEPPSAVKLLLRFTDGTSMTEEFGGEEPLSAVFARIDAGRYPEQGGAPYLLAQHLPRQNFGPHEEALPLAALGLAPRTLLSVVPNPGGHRPPPPPPGAAAPAAATAAQASDEGTEAPLEPEGTAAAAAGTDTAAESAPAGAGAPGPAAAEATEAAGPPPQLAVAVRLTDGSVLRSGFDHISTDSDAFFLANPVPHLQAGRAVAGLSDTLNDGTFPMGYCNEPDSPCQSTGFTYFRATPAVRNMVREFSSSYGGGFEQAQWNPYAARLVRMGEFDALPRFGNFTFANWNVMKESIANQESFTVAVMHMGGEQRGVSPGSTFWMDIKEYLYRCLQLWLDDSNTEVMEEHA
jgi:hypothetical protein